MTFTFKDYLIEDEPMAPLKTFTATFNDSYGSERTMIFKASSLEDASEDAKGVASSQGWQMPGLEQTDTEDANNQYQREQDWAAGDVDLSAEEEEAKLQGMRDMQKISRNYPKESGKRAPSIKRQGQRAGRRLRRIHGTGNPAANAEGNLDSIYRR